MTAFYLRQLSIFAMALALAVLLGAPAQTVKVKARTLQGLTIPAIAPGQRHPRPRRQGRGHGLYPQRRKVA